jgi:hypothetical protein
MHARQEPQPDDYGAEFGFHIGYLFCSVISIIRKFNVQSLASDHCPVNSINADVRPLGAS